ncbi:PREDICTED: protein fantom-like [Branchiostoma belcheri]|uniref:Protein fantom-like n=1 Tax=Branchiostoma belcheri TaxID=7741 RepID=A0A6P4ZDW4_BRABE|nr:PREDICTED: protein fantom-like [Branchiostoma belcheri]
MTDDRFDHIPVRDGPQFQRAGGMENEPPGQIQVKQRQIVAQLTRDELEDRYLRLYEENIILKRHGRKQEDKIKRMATKLLRLVNDKKKADQQGAGRGAARPGGPAKRGGRDIETEEMLEELHGKIRDLEKENRLLKEKVMVAKQQLSSQGKRHTPYTGVQSRINTGIKKVGQMVAVQQRLKPGMRVQGPEDVRTTSRSAQPSVLPRYGHSLLEEARGEIRSLEDLVSNLQDQIRDLEGEADMLREQMRLKDAEHEEELLRMRELMAAGQRGNIQENVDMIRLQRELKEKATKLTAMQAKYTNLEENLRTVKGSHDQVLREMDGLREHLKAEQNRVLRLQNDLKQGATAHRTIIELQERVVDLEKENDIIKEANTQLQMSAFDAERERQHRATETKLRVQIAQLEATLRSDLHEKNEVLDRVTLERSQNDKMREEQKNLQIQYYSTKQELDELKQKMQFFTKESAVDFQELEEALVLIKTRKERGSQNLDFLEKVEEEKSRDLQQRMVRLQAEHADTVNELEKTRNMLIIQHRINKDYQTEVESVSKRMEDLRKEYETKLEEYAKLLDIRAARIKKLERQLRDVAYGTKQYKLKPTEEEEEEDVEEIDETVHLERGENLFEIHIIKVVLSQEALDHLGDAEPSLFCTYEFYDFELQTTPVVRGAKPEFKFTSKYVVKVDDFFLHYLQKESTTLEVHQAMGLDYTTLAVCQLKFRDLLDKPQGRIFSTTYLTSPEGVNFGTVEYWVRLRVPMDQALRLFKERTKALGYIAANERATQQALQVLDESTAPRAKDNVNDLHIRVVRCSDLTARRDGVQPSPYVVYKFFDFPDHDTDIVMSSSSPQFNDHKTYPVPMDMQLDTYLKSAHLELYVFDDTDPEETAYLGRANVPLISLAHDKAIKGVFELKRADTSVNGNVEVHLRWQYAYLPPPMASMTPEQAAAAPGVVPEKPQLLPGKEEKLAAAVPPAAIRPIPPPITPASTPGHVTPPTVPTPKVPSAASTPRTLSPEHPPSVVVSPPGSKPPSRPTSAKTPSRPSSAKTVSRPSSAKSVQEAKPPPSPRTEAPKPVPRARQPVVPEPKPEPEPVVDEAEESSSTVSVTPESAAEEEESVSEEMKREELDETTKPEPEKEEQLGDTEPIEDTMFEEKPSSDIEEDIEEPSSEEDDVVMPAAPKKKEDEKADTDVSESLESDSDVVMSKPLASRQTSAQADDLTQKDGEDTDEMESDSDVVMSVTHSLGQSLGANNMVTVTIFEFQLNGDAAVLHDGNVRMLFVEYRFLGRPPEETETPFSLPKPSRANQPIKYNFRRVFHVDPENNELTRDYLISMLLPGDPSQGRIKFTVVNEPEDEEGECADIGHAYVDLKQILEKGEDVVEQDIDVVDVNDEREVIGALNVSVEALAALRAVQKELPALEES